MGKCKYVPGDVLIKHSGKATIVLVQRLTPENSPERLKIMDAETPWWFCTIKSGERVNKQPYQHGFGEGVFYSERFLNIWFRHADNSDFEDDG